MFVELLAGEPRLAVAPGTAPAFGLVCFRLAGGEAASESASEALLEAANATGAPAGFWACCCCRGLCSCRQSCRPPGRGLATDAPHPLPSFAAPHPGRVFLVGTKLDGLHTLRLAIGAADVQPRHIHAAWAVIRGALDGLAQA